MLVSTILQHKPGGVITAAPNMTIEQLAALLAARKIGAVVVSTDGAALGGIVSERDIVRALGQNGAAALPAPISSIMTSTVVTCTMNDSANSVLQRMTDGRFRHMPVMAHDAVIGMISIGDVVKARLSELAMEKDALEGMIKGF